MRAVAGKTFAALSARAPEIAFAFLNLHGVGGFLYCDGFGHLSSDLAVKRNIGWFANPEALLMQSGGFEHVVCVQL